jgi:hypothetical protein
MAMTGDQYDDLIAELGMTQRGAARFLGIGERSSRRFAAGNPIPPVIQILLRVMKAKGVTPEEAFQIAGFRLPDHYEDSTPFGDQRPPWMRPNS